MDRILKQSLLYDFYGELLTEHQKKVYEQVVLDDLSLGEAAEENGITRQGVHDLIRRCDRILEGYEKKLKLVDRFIRIRQQAGEISGLLDTIETDGHSAEITRIRELTGQILDEL